MIRRNAIRATLALLTTLLLSATVQAQLFRAYLASDGNDANPCTLAAPCRLLPAALTAVASGGEIWMLDSANYNSGTVTIGKSVSILAVPGVVGSLVALNGGPAISIAAAGLKVALRNVVIGPVAGATPGTSGVVMTGASSLAIENSLIANLPVKGISVSTGTLKVSDTTLRNNGSWAIWLQDGARAVISSTRMLDNGHGLYAYGNLAAATTTATLSDCVISGGGNGVQAWTDAATSALIWVARSTIERTNIAMDVENGAGIAEISVGSSLIVNNNYSWYQGTVGGGSTLYSLGNNQMSTGGLGDKTLLPGQ